MIAQSDTWGRAHWHPIVHWIQEGWIHVKRLLQGFTMYLKPRRGNVLIMFKLNLPQNIITKCSLTYIFWNNMILFPFIPTNPLDHIS